MFDRKYFPLLLFLIWSYFSLYNQIALNCLRRYYVGGPTSEPKGRVESKRRTQVTRANAKYKQRRGEALKVNISAGEGLQDVLKSNLGPSGTIKMYVRS